MKHRQIVFYLRPLHAHLSGGSQGCNCAAIANVPLALFLTVALTGLIALRVYGLSPPSYLGFQRKGPQLN